MPLDPGNMFESVVILCYKKIIFEKIRIKINMLVLGILDQINLKILK